MIKVYETIVNEGVEAVAIDDPGEGCTVCVFQHLPCAGLKCTSTSRNRADGVVFVTLEQAALVRMRGELR